jgi:hypothetical protein
MADNITTTTSGTGALPTATTIATRDTGTSHWQQVDVAPAVATPVAGGQYALSVGSGSPTTLTVPTGATHAIVSVDSGGSDIRWTVDGTTPTATVGVVLSAGDAMLVDSVAAFKMIGRTATATAQVAYFKYL